MSEFNELPTNFTRISENDFWVKFHNFVPQKRDLRQVDIGKGYPEDLIMFYYGKNKGIGFARCYDHKNSLLWTVPAVYFSFGE